MQHTTHETRRRVLTTLGTGIAGTLALTGSVSAEHDTTGDIMLEDLDFRPDEYTVSGLPDTVTWEHNDSGNGFIHNVALDHDKMVSRVKSDPLYHGDTYTVDFSTMEKQGTTYLVIKDDNQRATLPFDGSVDLHVHCDLHSPEMEMTGFTVES